MNEKVDDREREGGRDGSKWGWPISIEMLQCSALQCSAE